MSERPGDPVVALADRVAWLDMAVHGDDAVYVSTLPDGPPMVLRGTAGSIFVAAAEGGTVAELAIRVAEDAGEARETVEPDVVAFVDQLVGLRLVQMVETGT